MLSPQYCYFSLVLGFEGVTSGFFASSACVQKGKKFFRYVVMTGCTCRFCSLV